MAEEQAYRDLEIWRLGMDLVERVYVATREFPKHETYGLSSQLRRAASSVPANIAEGYGRGTRAALANSVRTARGSLAEVETFLELACRLGYLSKDQLDELNGLADSLGRKTYMFIKSLGQPAVKETAAVYGELADELDLINE
ncbi:MAG TPA: four helix bundle protein [Fimbriimonadaceae bacterium]|nr:four helix bundle protein [Fimbriimonadaceae bacterium]